MIKTVLFDLDGTLTDPSQGIYNSICFSLERFGISVSDKNKLAGFIGPPLYDSFRKYYGFSHDDANLAVKYYREYFAPKGLYENVIYNGVPEMLATLQAAGVNIGLATSKPEVFAEKIISHFALSKYFDFICGATLDESRNTKDSVIAYALDRFNASPSETVMVGDRIHDISGAKKNSLLYSIGVLYGFAPERELEDAGADFIAKDVLELTHIISELIRR